jgi:hypothetical protein
MRRLVPMLTIALSAALWLPAVAQGDFGIKRFSAGAFKESGAPELRAAAHPYAFNLAFEMNQDADGIPEGTLRELVIDLPPGMVGNPLVVPQCSGAEFEGVTTNCPGTTQIGVARVRATLFPGQTVVQPIYNLTPRQGVPASFGFRIADFNVFNEASLRSSDYGARISDFTIPTSVEVQAVEAEIWGVPAAPSHDPDRVCLVNGAIVRGCSSDAPKTPFLSLPTSCGPPLTWSLSVKSVQEPEAIESASAESLGPGGTPRGLTDCGEPPFDPSITLRPETSLSDSPTGLNVNLHIPQNESVTEVDLEPRDEVHRLEVINPVSGSFTLAFKGQSTGGSGLGDLTEGSNVISGLLAARGTGDLNEGVATVTGLNTTDGKFIVGQRISGVGIAPGTTIIAASGTSLTLSAPASAAGTAVALTSSGAPPFAVGQTIAGAGIPEGTTITAVDAVEGKLTLSAPVQAGASGTEVPITSGLAFDSTAAEIQAALQGLSTIGADNVLVSDAGGFYRVTFVEALSNQDVPLIEALFSGEGDALVTLLKQGRGRGVPGPEPLLATAHLKDTVVTLPQGLAINPSAADGRVGCPLTGPEGINLPGSGEPAQSEAAKCPAASKVGTVKVTSPLVDHPIAGNVYLARQGENPFGSLIALYVAVNDPQTGVVVKLAGKVEPDPLTGQLRTVFENNPQLPFEDFDFEFSGGPRAPLTTPPTCGTYITTAELTPWTFPEGPKVFLTDSFATTASPAGGCVGSEAQMPHAPSFEAGTVTPLGGAYSPFVLKLSRENGSQRLGAVSATLPPGLTGKLAGIERCSEAQLAVAASRDNPGDGALERQSPSCPAGSQVGTVTVGAGSGAPFYAQGKAYLSGPYKGAPLSLAIITPAVAGPFDLGAVLVRAAAHVNPKNAQITVKSDPLPRILEGIPLDVRSVVVEMSRERFILNPTNCDPMSLGVDALSSLGQSASLSNRFQVGGCRGLDFEPRFNLRLKGGTKRGDNPKLIATVQAKEGEANIARASVKLPRSAFLDQAHIRTVCTRVQFAAEACPPGSIYGKATAITPLLDEPLRGNVYLRSSNNKLPDLVVDLRGPASLPIRVELAGRTDSVKGALRNTFDLVPDAPVSKFRLELLGGKRGLVINSTDICSRAFRATVKLRAHSGAAHEARPVVQSDCGGRGERR